MKINEAADFFKTLLSQTDRKSEIKVYQTFSSILSDLKSRDLGDSQLYAIENELDALELTANPNKRKKHLKQKLAEFKKYLEDQFELTIEDHYKNTGIALGMIFGMLGGIIFGTTFGISNGLAFGMMPGMMIGFLIGQSMDKKAMRENRVMKIKTN